MKLSDLLEQRAQAVQSLRTLSDSAEQAGRDLNEAEQRSFKETRDQITELDARIERQKQLDAMERAAPAIVSAGNLGDDFEARAHRDFSIRRAIVGALPRDLGGGNEDAGLERELGQELQRRSGRQFQGIPIPDEALRPIEQRTLLAGSTAASLIPEVHRDDLFIPLLRSALVTERLGATVLSGLTGVVDIPRQTSSGSAQWVSEDGALTETDAGFDDVSLSPKTVGSLTSYSRRTLLSASPGIENLLRADLSKLLASAVDREAMLGNGTGNKPTGIVNHPDTVEYELEAQSNYMTWSDVLGFVASIESADALAGSLGWAFNGWATKRFRATTRVSGDAGAGFLMEAPGAMAGYPVAATTSLPGEPPNSDATVIFGDWSSLLIGRFSGVDVLPNGYLDGYYQRGRVALRAMQDVDIQIRHGESFSYCTTVPV